MKVVVVGLIYKSTAYLDLMMQGIRKYCLCDESVDYLIVGNDPVESVSTKLVAENIKHIIYHDPKPQDYYLNRVYRAWNFAGRQAEGDILVFINSDMGFSPNWLQNLLAALTETTIPCSRLVESGKLLSGMHAIGDKDFGRSPDSYREQDFLSFASAISNNSIEPGGLFMPCAIYKKDFIASGGYPEGNIYGSGAGTMVGPILQSGDDYFFHKNPIMATKSHITVFNSVVYHIQEGEKDESAATSPRFVVARPLPPRAMRRRR